jgi:hypothetical protein
MPAFVLPLSSFVVIFAMLRIAWEAFSADRRISFVRLSPGDSLRGA